MIIIDGDTFNIPVISIVRKAEFLDKFAERTEDGKLHRELIGVYYNYQLTFGQSSDPVEYAALWNRLSEPEEFHTVIVPDIWNGTDYVYEFSAYFSNVGDEIRKAKTGQPTFWRNLTVNFIAEAPART
jgi:hypothetical protein